MKSPIGIFDSGIGGLTVAKAVIELMPDQDIIYFGDTAHLPYGEKSVAAIRSYSVKIVNFLLSKNCKLILIACNTASAVAFELIKEYVGDRALVTNVIDPVVNYVAEQFPQRHIGVIATKATIKSGVYQKKLKSKGIRDLSALATPLLASVIEEGFFNNSVSKIVINNYLSNQTLSGIEVLILGCTHYPLIKNEIEEFYQGKVKVIDGSRLVAEYIAEIILKNEIKISKSKSFECYVSDLTESFEASTEIFLGRRVKLNLQEI